MNAKFVNAWNKYWENRSILSFFLFQFLKILDCPLIGEIKRANLLFRAENNVRLLQCPLITCPPFRKIFMRLWPELGRWKKLSTCQRCPPFRVSVNWREYCILYPTVEVKHIWQVYMTSELKIKLACVFTILPMIWIFIAVKNRYLNLTAVIKFRKTQNDLKRVEMK